MDLRGAAAEHVYKHEQRIYHDISALHDRALVTRDTFISILSPMVPHQQWWQCTGTPTRMMESGHALDRAQDTRPVGLAGCIHAPIQHGHRILSCQKQQEGSGTMRSVSSWIGPQAPHSVMARQALIYACLRLI